MKTKLLLALAVSASFAAPAFAEDFYIVRHGPSGPCQVVESRPTEKDITIVGGDKVYTTREEAQKQVAVVCPGH